MFRTIGDQVWAFDAEWIPDPAAGKALYKLSEDLPDRDVMTEMWRHGGATPEEPRPYLKTIMCRLVSVAAVVRTVKDGEVSVSIRSRPKDSSPEELREEAIVGPFLSAIGKIKPQLVGYNSAEADLKILVQRGIVLGLEAKEFCSRPEKPWGGVDYFAKTNECHLDLKQLVSGWGKGSPSLHELATLSGIPGKMDVDGNQVAELWLEGRYKEIVDYNEFDALTTYLVWLRMAHFAGLFTKEQYEYENDKVRELLAAEGELKGREHLHRYLDAWMSMTG